MTDPVSRHITIYTQLKERLSAIPEMADDPQALADTLDGETDLKDVLVGIMRQADLDEALASGVDARMDELNQRRQRFLNRYTKRRALIQWAMEEAGIGKIEAPDFTLSLSKGSASVVVTDENALPDRFVRVTTTKSPDKTAIGAALKAKEPVPGATLSNPGMRLTVRKS